MKKERDRINNKGYSLVELLVAIAILSIVVGAVIGFFMYVTKFYHSGNAESDLQNEAQLTMTQLETLVVNANQGVGLDPALPPSQTSGDEMFVYNRFMNETTGVASYQVTHIYTDNKKLKYCYMDYKRDPSGVYTLTGDKKNPQTLSDYVENFSVDVSKLLSNNSIHFSIDFKTRGNREYKTGNTVLLRNKVLDKTNGNADDYFKESVQEDEKREVTKLELSPKEFSMWAGTSAANPFTPVFYKKADDNTPVVTNKGSAVWTITTDPLPADTDVNRSTGAINLGKDARGDLTIRATDQGSITKAGLESKDYVYDEATIHVKSVDPKGTILTTPSQNHDNLSVATSIFTIHGENLTEADLNTITPVVTQGSSTLSVSITPDAALSNFAGTGSTSSLCYTVKITRPGNYIGKTYELGIRAVVPGNVECTASTTWTFIASPGDKDKVISAVKLTDSTGEINCEGGSVSVAADRGDDYTLIMYVKYKDKNGVESDYTPLPADSWGIKQSDTESGVTSSIVAGGSDYKIYMNAQDYNKDLSLDFTTTYSDGTGGEASGPSVRFTFSRVKFAVKNVLGNQKVFPVTSGKTSYIYFDVQGLKNASVFVKSGSGPGLSITPNGETASVTAANNAMVDADYVFGLKDSKGHVLDGVTCDVTVWPDKANTAAYNGGSTGDSVYIPSVSDISSIDPTKSAPEAGKTTTIFMPDGEKITYTNSSKQGVDGSTHKYWAEYKGKTYYYVQNSKQWRLNEK